MDWKVSFGIWRASSRIETGLTQIDLHLVEVPAGFSGNVIMAPVKRCESVKAVKAA